MSNYYESDEDSLPVLLSESEDNGNGISFSGLNPVLGSLGVMIGLLKQTDAASDSYELISDWFADPVGNIKTGFQSNSGKLGDLLSQLLGELGGNALGIPQDDPALLGTWYPIQIKNDQGIYAPTGLYLVSITNPVSSTALGLGVLKKWDIPVGSTSINVDVWALIPAVVVDSSGFSLTFTSDDNINPISVGVAVEGGGKDPIINENGISFNGLKLSANLFLSGKPRFDVTMEVLSMQLAGDAKPKNYSLADLGAITPQQIFETASNLFIGALSHQFSEDIQKKISYLAPLFGFSQSIPGNADVKLPVLAWYELFSIVSKQGNPAQPFIDWFNTITASPEMLNGWMSCLSGFISNTVGDIDITGDGSRNNPYQVPLLSVQNIGTLNFTTASVVVDNGSRFFYPGLSFSGNPIALGTSDAQFQIEADLELGKFQLSGTPQVDFDINFKTNFKLRNKTDKTPLISYGGYEVGTMAGGLAIGVNAGNIVPYLRLTDVVILGQSGDTPSRPLGTVDLLSPGQLADVGAQILSTQLQDFMGLNDPEASVFVQSIASLIGLIKPQTAKDWPAALSPPFSEDSMFGSITDPIGALSRYYQDTLSYTDPVDGERAFTYILQSFASLLQIGGTSITVSGAGSQQDPWKVGVSIGDASMPAYLTAYQENIGGDAANGFNLNLGFSFEPLLTIASVNIKPSLFIDALSLSFPKGKGTTAKWFNSVGAILALPDGFKTPAIGDAVFSVSNAQIEAGWGQTNGWNWSMLVSAPTLTIGENTPIVGADLNFSEQSTLEDLVKESAATFGPFFTNALGIFLMRNNTRVGFLATATLGLLTDFSKFEIFKNSGLTWDGFTALPLTSFADPLGLLRQQIASNFNTPEKAKSQLALLAWTLSSEAKAPSISGTGTLTDPYLSPFPGGFELAVWYDSTAEIIGTGFGRNDHFSYPSTDAKIAVDVLSNLRIIEYDLKSAAVVSDGNAPSFSFQTTISNPSGKLVEVTLPDGSSGSLDKILLGFDLSIVAGQLKFNPVVTLVQAKLFGEDTANDITLQQFMDGTFTEKAKSAFISLLNSGIQLAIQEVKGNALFQNVYSVLSVLGLTLPVDTAKNDAVFGINTGGWNGLLANADTYIQKQLLDLIQSPDNLQKLVQVFESIFDVKLPKIPRYALDLFSGLQIVGPASQNYPLYPQAILEIVSDPVNSLKNRFEALFKNPETLAALAKELTKNIPADAFGMFEISSTASGVVTLALPASAPFKIGDDANPFLEISGSLSLDFSNKALTVNLNSFVPILGFSLSNAFTVSYDGIAVHLNPPLASLTWGDGKTPAAAPLQILPFDSDAFIDSVAKIAPAYALNIFISSVFEDQFLNDTSESKASPVVRSVFELLGISKSEAGVWTMPSLLGIMEHPLDWLLSDEVLGVNGKFNIAKMVQLLSAFPTASYKPTDNINITIGPNDAKNGILISGLPYGFFAEMSGDGSKGVARFNFGSKEVSIADGKAKMDDLNFCVDVSADYQASFSGAAKLSTSIVPFFAEVGFDKTFALSITQGTPDAPKLNLQLLPFVGWGKLAEQAATMAAAEVINNVVPAILKALEPTAQTFVKALRGFGENVPVSELVSLLPPIVTSGKSQAEIIQELETVSLNWLKGLFTGAQLEKTLNGIQAVFSAVPNIGALSAKNGLLTFVPSPNIPISLYFGVDENNNLGLWAGLTVPDIKYVDISVARTGIGIDLATLSKPVFSFGIDIIIPVDEQNGPGLYLGYGADKGFSLAFDPQGSITDASARSAMSVELFPDFFSNPANLGDAVKAWLLQVIKNVLPRYVSILVLNNDTVQGWLKYNLFAKVSDTINLTPLQILEATTLVVSEGTDPKITYLLNTIDNIQKITPQSFLANFLQTLLKSEIQVFKFDSGGGIFIGPKKNAPGYLGVRLFAPDFKIDSLPNIVLQLGAKDDAWIKASSSSGTNTTDPGIQFYVPVTITPSIDVDFSKFNIILGNVGFDIVGEKGKPVIDLSRFKLGAVDPRILLELQFNGSSAPDVTFGGSLLLSEIGLSLAPDQLTTKSDDPKNPSAGNSSNPIASNLLGAGSDAKDSSSDNPPSNPTFSAQVSYLDKLAVSLISANGEGDEIIIPIQRAFGPLFVDSLGVGWNDKDTASPLLDFLFTGNVGLAGLNVSLIGLDVGIPVTNPTDFGAYRLDLAGLDVSFNGGSVAISGGLLKQDNPLQYIGSAVLKAGTFSIMALGAYAQVPDSDGKNVTSLFIFGALNMPLGGVPAFFITGVAAGFGYNRSIKIPAINEIMDYPLVAGVLNGSLTDSNDPGSALTKLSEIVAPEVGQYWLAAGLKFTSFQLIETAAVLFVSFGKELEFNLLGLSYASLPPKLSKDKALAYFELALKLSFKPSDGIISVEAQLTPNSFVLTQQCKLTGGFAFYLWYKNSTQTINGKQVNIPAGDFVISLGGYHPQFVPPAYYPSVPRLGFQWILDVSVGKVSITGGAYFAICPTAIMAGGYLSVLFEAGPLKAWLNAYANFIIEWKPFYFSVDIGITVGASFGTTILGVSITIKAELGAKLHLEGPAINGFVEVSWFVISFTIPVGEQKTETTNAALKGWDVFAQSFLPPDHVPQSKPSSDASQRMLKADGDVPVQQVIKWNAESGLLNSSNNEENSEDALWVVNPMYYSFNVVSAVPTNQVSITGTNYVQTGVPVGIRPMDYVDSLSAPIEVTVVNKNDPGTAIDMIGRGFDPARQENGSPAALWSKQAIVPTQAPSSEGMIIASTLLGVSFTANRYISTGSIPEFSIERLKYTDGSTKLLPFYNKIPYPTPAVMDQATPFTQIMRSIMADGSDSNYPKNVIQARNAIYAALSSLKASESDSTLSGSNIFSINAPLNPDLSVMKTSANLILQVFPVIAPIDVYQNGGEIVKSTARRAAYKVATAEPAHIPQKAVVEGSLRRYRSAAKLQANFNDLPELENYVESKWTDHTSLNRTMSSNEGGMAKKSASVESKRLYEGGAIVWKTDPKVRNVMNLDGDLSVMIISFDQYYALLEIIVIQGEEEYQLPENTGQVVIQAYDPEEHATVGWQKNSIFTKINPYWSLGDGCLFKVQNAKRISVNRQNDRQGVLEVNRLLENNKVTGSGDVISQGWHQTVLKTDSPYVGVLVEGSDIDAIRVSVAANAIPAVPGESEPVEIRTVNNQTLLVFKAAETDEPTSYTGIIVHSGDDAQRISGVYSMTGLDRSAEKVWSRLSLKYNALDPAAPKAAKSTKVSFTF